MNSTTDRMTRVFSLELQEREAVTSVGWLNSPWPNREQKRDRDRFYVLSSRTLKLSLGLVLLQENLQYLLQDLLQILQGSSISEAGQAPADSLKGIRGTGDFPWFLTLYLYSWLYLLSFS